MHQRHGDGYAAVGPAWGSVALKNMQPERETQTAKKWMEIISWTDETK